MAFESKLVPILREGVEVMKMIMFQKMRVFITEKYSQRERRFINMLTGAIINDLFGTINQKEPFLSFSKENQSLIKEGLQDIAIEFEEMRIPLTDALRVQFLCDAQEGYDSSSVLSRARDNGILIMERELPLPDHFVNLVRRLGESSQVIRQVSVGSA